MILKREITIDPIEMAENVCDDEILEFVVALNKELENEDFTIELITGLLVSLGMKEKEIDQTINTIILD